MSGLEGLLTGRTLVKRYKIEEVIGRGGFAVVYRAADERLGRTVAVKVITAPAPDAEARAQHQARFEREARAAASLSHPNIVTVHDFGTDPQLDIDFLVMEFLHGEDLATYLSRNGRPPLEMGMRILRDAAQGLAVGHRAGLVHRDVKPGNLFLAEPHGEDPFRVCVLDFGIARAMASDHTVTHHTQGVALSPAYASPEQARGERELTPASDVFSLGVVGFQLLTGEKPFSGERGVDPAEWVPARGLRDLEPSVPAAVEAVIHQAMSFDPRERFPDAAAMARALDEAADAGEAPVVVAAPAAQDATLMQTATAAAPPPPPAPAPAPARAPRPAPRRSRAGIWTLALVLLLALGGIALWAMSDDGSGEIDQAEVTTPQVEEMGPETGGPEPLEEGEEPAVAAGGTPQPSGGAVTAPSGNDASSGGAATPSAPVPAGAAPTRGTAASAGAPAASRPLPTARAPAASPQPTQPRPVQQRPAQPQPARPQPAAADSTRAAPMDSTPRPRLLGEPVRQPAPRPAPRDTTARPRADTAFVAQPDTAIDPAKGS